MSFNKKHTKNEEKIAKRQEKQIKKKLKKLNKRIEEIRELENEKATSFIISPSLGSEYTMGTKSGIS